MMSDEEARFSARVAVLAGLIGHADRVRPLHDYCLGLLMPVERVIITNTMGVQVVARELNGTTGFFTVELPVLQKGMYIVRVAGKDFQKTEKIMVQ